MRSLVSAAVTAGLICSAVVAQVPRGTAEVAVGSGSVEIEYGRPSLNGRDMLSRANAGFVWRMGADSATSLKTGVDLKFGDKAVPAGSYTLSARREESGWTLLISSGGQTVAEVALENGTNDEPVETFTIELQKEGGNSGVFTMAWGAMRASTGFSAES